MHEPVAVTPAPSELVDALADEAAELDGYFSDTPLDPQPEYPKLRDTFETAVIITNLPKVPEAKIEKLTKVVTKLVSRIGTLVSDEESGYTGLVMPFDPEKNSLGFCFVEFETKEQAKNAVEVLQDYKFDKNHSLSVTLYARAQKLNALETQTFQEPEPEPFEEKPNAIEWLQDEDQRDSFVIRYGEETIVKWFDGKTVPAVDYDGSRAKEAGVQWCEYYCYWSPQGSYLATLVPSRGVMLWSGANYEKCGRFVAEGVKIVHFSPQENYLLTNNHDSRDPAAIKVYQIATGKLLRAFPLFPDGVSMDEPPPPFEWSHDDKYLARKGDNLISIYETPSMKLLEKRSLAAEGVVQFQWSPEANILAYWAPEAKNAPAHVDIIEIPSRKKLRQKNLFNVTKCNMVWHQQGYYLAVRVTRHTKSKKTLLNNIELFRLNQPGVPVEMLDVKDHVSRFAWEPHGSRFAMIHAENKGASKVSVSFYDMMKKQEASTIPGMGKKGPKKNLPDLPELNLVKTLEGKQCNCLFWSPAGSTIIMASLGDTASGTLEFYDVDTGSLVVKEHYRANEIVWDPDGRCAASVVSQPIGGGHFKFSMDNGYILWSFQGKQLTQESFETFYQFLWRPRPKRLSAKQIADVKKNIKKYEEQFEKADYERQRKRRLEETKGKREERAKIRELLAKNRAFLSEKRSEHIALLGGYDSEDESHYVIRDLTVETVLSSKDEVVV